MIYRISYVGILRLGLETVAGGPGDGFLGITSVATVGRGITVDELLLGKRDSLSLLHLVEGFDSANGGEGPA